MPQPENGTSKIGGSLGRGDSGNFRPEMTFTEACYLNSCSPQVSLLEAGETIFFSYRNFFSSFQNVAFTPTQGPMTSLTSIRHNFQFYYKFLLKRVCASRVWLHPNDGHSLNNCLPIPPFPSPNPSSFAESLVCEKVNNPFNRNESQEVEREGGEGEG